MALQYKYYDRPKDIDTCLNLLSSTIVPLLKEHWDKYGKPVYNKEFSLNTEAFVTLWLSTGFTLVIAYDDNQPVGIFIGLRVVPMEFNARILQVETCYGKTAEVEEGLYNYIRDIGSILGYDELWLNTDTNKNVSAVKGFKLEGETSIVRFIRE